jgi:hypothetical protein
VADDLKKSPTLQEVWRFLNIKWDKEAGSPFGVAQDKLSHARGDGDGNGWIRGERGRLIGIVSPEFSKQENGYINYTTSP